MDDESAVGGVREGTLVGVVVGWPVLPLLVEGITGGIDPSAAVSIHKQNNLTSYIHTDLIDLHKW